METSVIARALEAALPSVELGGRPLEGFMQLPLPEEERRRLIDLMVLSQSTVSVQNEDVFQKFVDTLRGENKIADLENQRFVGGGGAIRIDEVAKSMLAQALKGQNSEEIVESLTELISTNRSEALTVMTVIGVEVDEEIDLGGGVSLKPVRELPYSALSRIGSRPPRVFSLAATNSGRSALVKKTVVSPVTFALDDDASETGTPTRLQFEAAVACLDEAISCLTLWDCKPIFGHVSWSEFGVHPVLTGHRR